MVFTLTCVFLFANASFYYRNASEQELDETAQKVAEYILAGNKITREALIDLKPGKNVEISVMSEVDKVIVNTSRIEEFSIGYRTVAPSPNGTRVEDALAQGVGGFLGFDGDESPPMAVQLSGAHYMTGEELINVNGSLVRIMVFRPYSTEIRALKLFSDMFLWANIIGVLGAFLIGRYISKVLLRPINAIRRTAAEIGVEDLSRRIILNGPNDEIKKLADTFNDMIGRLEISFNKQSRFISDASHELRTPISVIQGYANLIDRWGKSDPNILQESIDSIKSETEHMSMMVKKLLLLARDKQQINKQRVSLGFVVSEVIKEAAVMSEGGASRYSQIELREESEEIVTGDLGLLKQMLWIFIENSQKYCAKEVCSIIIRIYNREGHPELSVRDDGAGISEEDLPFIFERFYRADKSRGYETSGTGLGLSIAEWIIKQHDASVLVKSALNQGTEMIVTFPKLTAKNFA
jgi:signal transduction histidine kinase